jgi:4-amino-4-deoxy-L-arabinose transferase-like glycosyltransferase
MLKEFSQLHSKTIEHLVAALTDPARRERTAIAVLLAYDAIWTLYGALEKSSQDVHVDMAEMFAWSRELAFGYPKHPPLGAWLTAAWFGLFPVSDWAFYFLGMTVAAFALWIAWRLAEDYLDGEKRVLALVLLMLVPFFNFHALKFNANTVLLPMWGATALSFLRSFERRSNTWAALAGLCAAGAMLGKYWSIFLLIGLGLAALVDTRRRSYFRSAAPWVTIMVGMLALAPHVVWLFSNDFAPFHYAIASHAKSSSAVLLSIVGYLAGSAGYVAIPVLLVLVVIRPNRLVLADLLWPATPERRLVVTAFWAPLVLPAVVAPLAGFEINSLWSMSAWTLLPVVVLSSPLITFESRCNLAIATAASILPLLMVVVAPVIAIAIHLGGGASAVHSELLAERVMKEWRKRTEWPLRMVGGDDRLAYGVAFYLPSRPSAFPDFNQSTVPWLNLVLVRHNGIAIVCRATDLTCPVRAAAQGLTGSRIDVEIARSYFGVVGQPGRYTIIIVPPRGS